MLEDANKLKNDADCQPVISPGGATPLHVASSKNYLRVMRCVCVCVGGRGGGRVGRCGCVFAVMCTSDVPALLKHL